VRRAILGEGGDENEPTWLHRMLHLSNVRGAVSRFSEKVEYGAIVPDRVVGWWKWHAADVAFEPPNCGRSRSKPRLRDREASRRKIEYCDVAVAAAYQLVDEHGCPAANIDDRQIEVGRDALYEGE
jgi:hypothetical protein